jgi:hypothetical protein
MMMSIMKRWPLLLGAVLLSTTAAADLHAQMGIKGGVSHGSISNTGVLPGDLGARTGFVVGLSFASAPAVVGLGVEALYAQRGAEEPNNPSSRELDYVDIPVYVRLMAPSEGVAPYAYAGPQISFEVNCRTGPEECPETGRPSTTYAGIIGAGLRLGGMSALTIEARYVYGLNDLDIDTVTEEENYRDRSFMILAGISF